MKYSRAIQWPIFVISLSDATDRRAALSKQLLDEGIQAEFRDAVDGRRGLPSEVEHLVDRAAAQVKVGRLITDAEFACALSHRFIYETMVREGLTGAIVLEDDAILTREFFEFASYSGDMPADLIQLDHQKARAFRWKKPVRIGGTEFFRLPDAGQLTTGYFISNKAAEVIVNATIPLSSLADWPCDLSDLRILASADTMVKHPDPSTSHSYIEDARRTMKRSARLSNATKKEGAKKYLTSRYWRRWWIKRITVRIS